MGWGGGCHPVSSPNIVKIYASYNNFNMLFMCAHYILPSPCVRHIPLATLSKDVSEVESDFHTSLPFSIFTPPYFVTTGTLNLSYFFYPRSFLLYQFLPFLLSCYFNKVLLRKFK